MNSESEALINAANTAAQSTPAKVAGVSLALKLLVSWVQSIEMRLEKIQNGRS